MTEPDDGKPGQRSETLGEAQMANSVEYRQRAEEQRMLARSAVLPMVREMHSVAADRWNSLADAAELSEAARPVTAVRRQDIFY